ncbi:cysteine--tRNA ligase [Candidatus Uhrbacteria bacterium RIFCSPHIGHO2_02_FULL_47_44]|uniref:Cysteine--tRNA ligase n=1 Tax=Candidatus Uhrbacteria bacterium RIFCSPLOWO2_02_FULL_48_18 TaxID=1802408 RepID=A0A1F7V9E3_9BACT|nr:MAG: cysteine--tRNA ligase [Candidatus Uhrbacteria bacterium RIFCSPHIGHO2_01_FULL_47_10]OGL70780.1 MAG: cysteine--tRNA ligase [Candidatus Uhrbacteria bacterium RIFCSPHIGHO2_02_FULL_47_44]OGL76505.1 MAG: cysteine--tRNA ligase [Candidatus Uhrbacteria bacterium RIFCSPHIGHO2_12_FULL_47_12]OGL82228.1 MAG: cysteine--tRNA ligase [Candidatus Uhrbacteria bacterium RIFCSPLOWO2_01_FULL_47_17]OGL86718.1 MAG: cysteine--tRNA ligase [Candidatus Uhrbacteria bacterium RIFCSPLOWO2_02_FULL_48_18]OGL92433.1 MA
MQLYNTLTRSKQEFNPIQNKRVGVYSCGPTVYWFAHIGNMRAFLFADLLCRALRMNGYAVEQIMNITDVGHLTDDADEGEDKMMVAMKREGKTAYDIAEFYAQAFFKDLEALNITPASRYPRATEHIAEQIEMIEALEKNGFTYQTSDGIYFDTSKLADYGRLSGQKLDEKQAGSRVDMGEKKNATDFALWKFSPTTGSGNTKRQMEWESPWGIGFPGWHIECSAMSKKYLGVPFDIHTGGIDHIAVHHENEIAQTEGAEGKLEANYWMHNEFITVDGGKMSKSLGNVYTIEQLVEKGFDPLAFRYLCLQAHYRSKLNFTWESLEAAQNALNRLRSTIREWDAPLAPSLFEGEGGGRGIALEARFSQAINDDLNTPEALSILWQLVDSDYPTSAKAESLLKFDQILGLHLDQFIGKSVEIPPEVQKLLDERAHARTEKNWSESDRLRTEIEERGFIVEDKPEGQNVREM